MGDTSPIGDRRTKYADSAKRGIVFHSICPEEGKCPTFVVCCRRYFAYRLQAADHTHQALKDVVVEESMTLRKHGCVASYTQGREPNP
jgi:hypothetical protein